MQATARWLDRLVRAACARPEGNVRFTRHRWDDAATLRSSLALVEPLAPLVPAARQGVDTANELMRAIDKDGRLPDALAEGPRALVAMLEAALA